MKTNATLLALLIFGMSLAGCVSESDAVPEIILQDDNSPPVISVSIGDSTFVQYADCTGVAGLSIEVRHAMTDWNGTIQQAGWDINLDGVIDFPVTTDEGYTTLYMPITDFIWKNSSSSVLENSFAFGAQDDQGAFTSSEIFLISEPEPIADNETCRDFPDISGYNFEFTDHSDTISGGLGDYMLNITRTNGQSAINWENIRIYIENYDCLESVHCDIVLQTGQDNLTWEANEVIILREHTIGPLQNTWGQYESPGSGDEFEIEIWMKLDGCSGSNCWESIQHTIVLN